MKKPLPEVNSRRVTYAGKEGYGSARRAAIAATLKNAKPSRPDGAQRIQDRELMDKNRISRRVRLYYWKQWKQLRTRRRHLLALGVFPGKVHMATRSRKGYWRMSQNEIVRYALNNRWLEGARSSRSECSGRDSGSGKFA